MPITKTVVEIMNQSLQVVAQIKSLHPFDKGGTILQYSKELSNYGRCKFRISAFDTILTTYGDILEPHRYHVRVRRGNYVVWQGAIVNNKKRTKDYIDIEAVEYEFYLDKKLVHRTSADINGTADIYRTFSSGTMAAAVNAIMTETIADYASSNHVLRNMTIGDIENPDYPPEMVSDYADGSGAVGALTGEWNFGDGSVGNKGPTLQFDYHTILYILRSFGIYSYADFRINYDLTFDFVKFLGDNRLASLQFTYGVNGNIVDYNLPRFGERQVNNLWGLATDPNGVILHVNPTDQESIVRYGLMEGVAAYSDVKSQSILNARGNAELPFISTADETNATVYLNEKGYPLGQYDIGDIVTVKIENKGVDFEQIRRIVGITVVLNQTGREMIALQTNIPQEWQYADLTQKGVG